MRDKIKDRAYFETYIAEEEESAEELKAFLEDNRDTGTDSDRIANIKAEIDSIMFSIFKAKFSAGFDLEEIKTDFTQLVRDMPQYWHPLYGYMDILDRLSIAVMYDIDIELWDILVQLVDDNDLGDWLVYFLIASKNEGIQYEKYELKVKKPYKILMDFIRGNTNDAAILMKYLKDVWYKSNSDVGWYDSHKHWDNLYCGYWSWECGAIVKLLKVDDAELQHLPFYPYDLVHYKDTPNV